MSESFCSGATDEVLFLYALAKAHDGCGNHSSRPSHRVPNEPSQLSPEWRLFQTQYAIEYYHWHDGIDQICSPVIWILCSIAILTATIVGATRIRTAKWKDSLNFTCDKLVVSTHVSILNVRERERPRSRFNKQMLLEPPQARDESVSCIFEVDCWCLLASISTSAGALALASPE